MMHSHVGPEPIDISAVIDMVRRPGNGGITTFLGTVRDEADGSALVGLEYTAYIEMAQKELRKIVGQAAAIGTGVDIAAVHRIGSLAVGDVSVVIAAGHAHRDSAFEACRYVIEEIKRRVPIWKRERYATGDSEWVVPADAAVAVAAAAARPVAVPPTGA
ncbi:MAG: molybdenum cofactor biosynthesis protein MoaE [Gemmatimonadaceae bacterium]